MPDPSGFALRPFLLSDLAFCFLFCNFFIDIDLFYL